MIPRADYILKIKEALDHNPIAVLLGPRQCGKTTLARQWGVSTPHEFFDLENPIDLARLSSPLYTLQQLKGLVIIDEAQRMPELFSLLRVLVDRPDNRAVFLLLGSASPQLIRGVSESLAGRAALIEMSGFNLAETGKDSFPQLWHTGGFPRSYLASSEETSYQWRLDFIRTFLERDIPQLGITIHAAQLRRFWVMLAHYHGQIFNASELARSLGISAPTVGHYLDILSGAYIVRVLQPWHENIKKRQVKSPKVYIRDSGLFHALLSLDRSSAVMAHPKLGASWEGFAIEQAVAILDLQETYFWAVHSGAEIDLFFHRSGKRYGIECKFTDAPTMTKSLATAIADLQLDRSFILYPGDKSYMLENNVRVVGIRDIQSIPHT